MRSRAFVAATIFGAFAIAIASIVPGMLGRSLGDTGRRIVVAGDPSVVPQARRLLAKDFHVVGAANGAPANLVIVRAGAHGLRVRVVGDDSPAEVATIATDLVPLNVGTGALPATAATRTIAYAMVVLLYLSILMNSQNIMSSVAEEKTSRIAEFLVASVSPMQLLGGKILAASATGAAQMAIWASAALIASRFVGGGPAATLGIMGVLTPPVVAGLIAFFLIGFVQYALLYAAAASLISRTEDLGSVAGPLVFPVLLGFVFAEVAALAPNAPQLAVLSLIPLISPFVMFTRIVVASAPAWQIVLALAVNLGAIALIARLAGKIYRVGLLTYGRTPKLSQVWATLRA